MSKTPNTTPEQDPFVARESTRKAPQPPEPEPFEQINEDVPTGTTKELLDWVGDDKDRAQRALDVELENDKPRNGLVKSLKEIAEAE